MIKDFRLFNQSIDKKREKNSIERRKNNINIRSSYFKEKELIEFDEIYHLLINTFTSNKQIILLNKLLDLGYEDLFNQIKKEELYGEILLDSYSLKPQHLNS